MITYQRAGVASTPWGELTLFWISAYGGGLFLPFRDATAPVETYGAGRYLADTVKGTFGAGSHFSIPVACGWTSITPTIRHAFMTIGGRARWPRRRID